MARTTIALSTETRDRLKELGRKGESYDELVNRLIDRHLGIQASHSGKSGKVDFERVR